MPISGNDDCGYWYNPEKTIEDKIIQVGDDKYCVSLDKSPDFESWRPYSVTVHIAGSEGGSMYLALWTFESKEKAEQFYDMMSYINPKSNTSFLAEHLQGDII